MAIANQKPQPLADGQQDAAPGRRGRYGEEYVIPVSTGRHNLAEEGSYFSFITPTPGTGIIDGAVTTFVETTPSLVIYNGTGSQLVMDFIRETCTVAPIGGTRVRRTITIDNGNRYTSGGTALTVSNTNSKSALSASGVTAYTGALVATAASASRRIIADPIFRWATIGIVGDIYETVFGQQGATPSHTPIATIATFVKNVPPCVIGAGDSLVIVQWEGSQSTAPTVAIEGGFWLR